MQITVLLSVCQDKMLFSPKIDHVIKQKSVDSVIFVK